MVLPALLGYWVDQQLGTRMVFLILGVLAGLTGGIWHLIQITASIDRRQQPGQEGGSPQGQGNHLPPDGPSDTNDRTETP
jgi:F0F1-type ATP synthase assembly protein I